MKDKKNTSKKSQDFFKKGDIIIVVLVVVLAILTLVFAFSNNADEAEIYIDGELKYSLDLSTDTEIEILDGKMIVAVKNGKISVKESNCLEQLCVHSSALSNEGGMIVCLPNKVVIKVVSREVDAIT